MKILRLRPFLFIQILLLYLMMSNVMLWWWKNWKKIGIILCISDNDFTDKGLNHISKNLNLHDLSIQDCPNLTASAISKFKKENPRCYVNSSSQARLIKEEIPIDEIREETKLFETRELLNKKSSKQAK